MGLLLVKAHRRALSKIAIVSSWRGVNEASNIFQSNRKDLVEPKDVVEFRLAYNAARKTDHLKEEVATLRRC